MNFSNSIGIKKISNFSNDIISDEINLNIENENFIINKIKKNDNKTRDINEFKLHYLRKNIPDFNCDNYNGGNIKKYVEKTIFIMFLILKIDNYRFHQPKKVLYKQLMKISRIIEPENIKEDTFEIDMVINGLYLKELKLLINGYPNRFFFKEQLKLDEININQKINVISEISRDIIKEISKKINKEEKYIHIIKAFNKFRIEEILAIINDEYKKIIDSFLIEIDNENIFIIITNGSYLLLQFALKLITSIFEKYKRSDISDKEIKKFIKIEIEKEAKNKEFSLIYNIIQNISDISEKLFTFYKIIYNLNINNIKYCIFYID